jgi:hypothetical protein
MTILVILLITKLALNTNIITVLRVENIFKVALSSDRNIDPYITIIRYYSLF